MPGPWVCPSTDRDGWESTHLHEGDYVEIACYDTSHCRQGTALVRLDRLAERSKRGQWAEASFIAVSDEHLRWWMDSGEGQADAWQFEVHFCPMGQRGCREGKRGRGKDFHADRFRVVTVGDLSDKKIDWLKVPPSKKYVEEELQRLSDLPTGKAAEEGGGGAGGLGFDEQHLPPADPSEGHEALKGLTELEKEIGRGRQARKRQGTPERERAPTGEKPKEAEKEKKRMKKKKRKKNEDAAAHGRASSAPGGPSDKGWFGQPAREPEVLSSSSSSSSTPAKKKKKKKKKEKGRARGSKDRGPFGAGAKMDYGGGELASDDSSEDSQLFREGPHSGGASLQLMLQEYAQRRPGRLASRLLQKMQVMVAKEGGPLTTLRTGSRTPPVATNWTLTMMAPKQPPIRLLREMRTLAMALDEIAAGRYQYAADVLAQRLKALELFQSDGGWNRAQYLELLDAEGPSLLGRDEAVMASKEWAGELRMRRLQTKGGGKGDPKGDPKRDPKGDPKGDKGGRKGKGGKGKEAPQE